MSGRICIDLIDHHIDIGELRCLGRDPHHHPLNFLPRQLQLVELSHEIESQRGDAGGDNPCDMNAFIKRIVKLEKKEDYCLCSYKLSGD